MNSEKAELQEMYNENLQKLLELDEEKEGLKMLLASKDSKIQDLHNSIIREK